MRRLTRSHICNVACSDACVTRQPCSALARRHPGDRQMASILIVDDDKVVQIFTKLMLEREGHRVTCASDGPRAPHSPQRRFRSAHHRYLHARDERAGDDEAGASVPPGDPDHRHVRSRGLTGRRVRARFSRDVHRARRRLSPPEAPQIGGSSLARGPVPCAGEWLVSAPLVSSHIRSRPMLASPEAKICCGIMES